MKLHLLVSRPVTCAVLSLKLGKKPDVAVYRVNLEKVLLAIKINHR